MLGIRTKQTDQQNFANNYKLQQNQLNPHNGNAYSGTPYSMSGNPKQDSNLKQNFSNGYSNQYHRNDDNKQNIRRAQNENQMIGQRGMNYAGTKENKSSNPQTQYDDGVRNENQKVHDQRDTSIQEPSESKV